MHGSYHIALTVAALMMLSAVSSADRLYEEGGPQTAEQLIGVPGAEGGGAGGSWSSTAWDRSAVCSTFS